VSKLSHFQVTISDFIFPLPELVIPFPVLFAGYFAVPGRRIKALMTKMLLEETKTVAGIVMFHGVDSECVPELMRGDIVDFTGFRINKFWQAGFFCARFDNLPGAMTVDAKNRLPAVDFYRTAEVDLFLK